MHEEDNDIHTVAISGQVHQFLFSKRLSVTVRVLGSVPICQLLFIYVRMNVHAVHLIIYPHLSS